MVEAVLSAVREMQAILDDSKENVDGGLHLRLCDAAQVVYDKAEALKEEGSDDEEEESDPEPEERTEDDMELNELSELWESHFDNGSDRAMMPIEGLMETIVMGCEAKRVCAAVRVLNRAVRGANPDDPADAEKLLQWKEDLIEERAIFVCGEILEKVDGREFHNETHEEHWLYSILCDEILELFQRLGQGDALFRTKLRRNGALKSAQEYAKEHPTDSAAQDVVDMLRQR